MPIDGRVQALLNKHGERQEVAADVRGCLDKLVRALEKKYPGHRDEIRAQLEGQCQRLLSAAKEEKAHARKRNGGV
jgi:hypothetical protein